MQPLAAPRTEVDTQGRLATVVDDQTILHRSCRVNDETVRTVETIGVRFTDPFHLSAHDFTTVIARAHRGSPLCPSYLPCPLRHRLYHRRFRLLREPLLS